MNPNTIYKKTEKGTEEINTRKYGLSQELRRVLIFVDGTSNVSKILAKAAGFPNIEQHLDTLARQGFVHAEEAVVTVSDIKAELIAVAQQILGSDAEKIVNKLRESHDSKDALQDTVSNCKRMVRLVIDEKKAEELMSRCSEILAKL
jgi:hypothetical protein